MSAFFGFFEPAGVPYLVAAYAVAIGGFAAYRLHLARERARLRRELDESGD